MLQIWDKDSEDQWFCSASFKAHTGSVWRVTWAHPEFGQIIATCSFDRTVGVWEEKGCNSPTSSSPSRPAQQQQQQQQQQQSQSQSQSQSQWQGSSGSQQPASSTHPSHTVHRPSSTWVKRALLVDSRSSITDIKFAPKHLGLLLATCSSDGTVRIYEAPDIMNLGEWNPQSDLNCKMSCSCLSWNPSPFHVPMLAVGSDEPASDPVPLSTSATPNVMSQMSSLFSRGNISSSSSIQSTATNSSNIPLGRVMIFESGENSRRWFLVEILNRICEPVHDLAFACSVGRDYHLLAIASSDVKIFTLKDTSGSQHQLNDSTIASTSRSQSQPPDPSSPVSKYEIQQLAKFDDHASRVWRLSWNLTGTILASSGEDGRVRLWKCESHYMTPASFYICVFPTASQLTIWTPGSL